MTHRQTWKNLEKKVASMLNGKRIGCTGLSTPDVLSDRFVIECKYRASLAFKKWYEQAVRYAEKTEKIPLLVCKEKGQNGEFVILKLEHFKELISNDQ